MFVSNTVERETAAARNRDRGTTAIDRSMAVAGLVVAAPVVIVVFIVALLGQPLLRYYERHRIPSAHQPEP